MTNKTTNINKGKTTNIKSSNYPELIVVSIDKFKRGNQYNKAVDNQLNDQRNSHKQENKENKETTTSSTELHKIVLTLEVNTLVVFFFLFSLPAIIEESQP